MILTRSQERGIVKMRTGSTYFEEVKQMAQDKVYLELPPFTGRNVPIIEIAKAMHKDAQYVRVGLQQGIFRFGYAIKLDDSNEYNYYFPDRKVWEEIGYFQPEAV
jgi:hypothetical protein